MGITGLHDILKPIMVRKSIKAYKKKRIGIDGHAWIYMISHVFAEEIYNNVPITKHADLFMRKIRSLTKYEITPIVVFDGDPLISKEVTNNERKEKKNEIRNRVKTALECGEIARAKMLMRQCISISKELLVPVILALREEKIEFMFAPYESDAQLCYLEKIRYIDYIMTEDSDLVVFGAEKVLYKFDGQFVDEYLRNDLEKCRDGFFAKNILEIAILSGCDYINSIKGIGLIKAHSLLKKYGNREAVVKFLSSKKEIPPLYLKNFDRAVLTFKYHIVYNPLTKNRVHLNPLTSPIVDDLNFLGLINHDSSIRFADGLHIIDNVCNISRPDKISDKPNSLDISQESFRKKIKKSLQTADDMDGSHKPLLIESSEDISLVSIKDRLQCSDHIVVSSSHPNLHRNSTSTPIKKEPIRIAIKDKSSKQSSTQDYSRAKEEIRGFPKESEACKDLESQKLSKHFDPSNHIVSSRIILRNTRPMKEATKNEIIVDENETCPIFEDRIE